jgi:hypothetical protein
MGRTDNRRGEWSGTVVARGGWAGRELECKDGQCQAVERSVETAEVRGWTSVSWSVMSGQTTDAGSRDHKTEKAGRAGVKTSGTLEREETAARMLDGGGAHEDGGQERMPRMLVASRVEPKMGIGQRLRSGCTRWSCESREGHTVLDRVVYLRSNGQVCRLQEDEEVVSEGLRATSRGQQSVNHVREPRTRPVRGGVVAARGGSRARRVVLRSEVEAGEQCV